MNKKFSTLLAGMALLSVMSVNAQTTPSRVDPETVLGQEWRLGGLKEGANSGLYQLKVMDGTTPAYLAMELNRGTGDYELRVYSASEAKNNLEATLWCVSVSNYNQGQAPIYDFQNKLSGTMLDLTMAGHEKTENGTNGAWKPVLGGEIAGWAFSRSYKDLEEKRPLYSYFSTDSIVGLKADPTTGAVKVAKWGANQIDATSNAADVTNFALVGAAQIALSEDQVNTKLGLLQDNKAGVQLTFTPDVKGTSLKNPFNEQKFIAEDKDNNKWLFIKQKDKEAYLKVDTAYTNETGTKFLAYGWTEKAKDKADAYSSISSELRAQHQFKFIYSPSGDSLYIYVKKVTWNNDGKYWNTHVTATPVNEHEFWRVSLQDLIKDETCILTVDPEDQNTHISLGLSGCEEKGSSKTSVDDGVYFIKNKQGQYLASPIHKNGDIEWVTVNDKQDVNHMPAFQWVVLKTNPADKNNVSSIQIWNREFATKGVNSAASIQLNTPADKDYYYVTKDVIVDGSTKLIANDKLTIKEVEAKYQSDKYLGYKKIAKNDLLVNKYTFNYYHPYSSDKFIAQSEKDSVLTVLDGKDAFVLDTVQYNRATGADEAYGYVIPSKDIQKRLPNLVQLYRTVYTAMKGDLNWAINKEDKFNVSKYFGATAEGNTKATPFFFKENNCIDGVHYYAILSTQWDSNKKVYTIVERDNDKAGVSDYDGNATLKAQILSETRTSAFAIAPDNSPLYRRFNNVALGESATDAADSLVFVEKYRKEYLMDEMNHSFMDKDNEVDYLGIWSKEHAKGNLAMRIDTAWLNRGAGNVKPQYLISVARDDQGAIETIPCDEADDKHFYIDEKGNAHKTDKWNCQHAKQGRAGFAYGKYLVSFADSARMEDSQKQPWMDIVNGYTRVGFVKAVHAGDSLFILVNEFKNMKPADLDTAEIVKAYKAAKINTQYIVNLQGDQHKNVTWSFRYVNPENAGKVTEEGDDNAFMFESNVYTDSQTSTPSVDYAEGAEKNIPLGNVHAKLNNAIAPMYAAWLKMQNGCLVLTRYDSDFNSSKTGGDAALVFNVAQKTDEDGMVTSNDEVSVEGVSVVSGNGAVTVQGAAGKSVVITNILGKVVAETILTSDNATIFVPAGIVAVAVDGEEAVKVVVK